MVLLASLPDRSLDPDPEVGGLPEWDSCAFRGAGTSVSLNSLPARDVRVFFASAMEKNPFMPTMFSSSYFPTNACKLKFVRTESSSVMPNVVDF